VIDIFFILHIHIYVLPMLNFEIHMGFRPRDYLQKKYQCVCFTGMFATIQFFLSLASSEKLNIYRYVLEIIYFFVGFLFQRNVHVLILTILFLYLLHNIFIYFKEDIKALHLSLNGPYINIIYYIFYLYIIRP
jgi:ABC-type proline/glycine betaine transport system permease subunit